MAEKNRNELDWNETMVVRRAGGVVTSWAIWRNSLERFADPKMWTDPTVWHQKDWRLLDAPRLSMGGYGLVVVDMDAQRLWSINDWMVPGAVMLPQAEENQWLSPEDRDKKHQGLLQLLEQPQQWAGVEFEVAPAPFNLKVRSIKRKTVWHLDQWLDDPSIAPHEALQKLTGHRGTWVGQGGGGIVLYGKLSMPGWEVITDRGVARIDVLTEMLTTLIGLNWPALDWTDLRADLESRLEDEEENQHDAWRARWDALALRWSQAAQTTPSASALTKSSRAPSSKK